MNQLALNPKSAKLPEVYNAAKATLAKCASLDECKQWSDKAAALASYARQADDKSLQMMAERIRARAVRRCGELLQQIEKAKNQHDAKKRAKAGAVPSTKQAAADAGMSERQQKTAIRVANVPQSEFDKAIDSEDPPTVTELAERGTEKKPKPLVDLQGRDPLDFNRSTHAIAHLREFVEATDKWDYASISRGAFKEEHAEIMALIRSAREALSSLEGAMEKEMKREPNAA